VSILAYNSIVFKYCMCTVTLVSNTYFILINRRKGNSADASSNTSASFSPHLPRLSRKKHNRVFTLYEWWHASVVIHKDDQHITSIYKYHPIW